MGFLRRPISIGVSAARHGLGLGVDVGRAVAGRVLPGQRSGDDTVWVVPTAPSPPDAPAGTGSAPPAAAPPAPTGGEPEAADVAVEGGLPGVAPPVPPPTPRPVPPPPPGARPAPPPFEPPPLPAEEAELVAEVGDPGEVGATVHVEGEPFPGYDALHAPEIVARLQDADEPTRAVVRLYEQANKQRRTILEATER